LPKPELDAVLALIADLAAGDLVDHQERYILLFDRTRSLSLHLFEHVHGESRDRGQAMVDLRALYEKAGLSQSTRDLPDFLPALLEFAATRSAAEAIELVGQPGQVLAALRERLLKRKSPYAAVFAALMAFARIKPDAEVLARLLHEPDPEPTDLAALDADWEEEEVRFGPAAEACGHDALAAKLRQVRRPAPGIAPPRPGANRPVITTPNGPRA
jgi:nitrate reductase delta subunit